ncbi:Uncharacterized protein TCM_020107 [Theobroma cacao]|uniref:Uncharacterized protein n=1 Tax=Theobroma cacao TaxID=3641 RepID=A0A061ERM2_THECC|nr:Uncharacterized protein TCM_020107 [Theobroma cacao]
MDYVRGSMFFCVCLLVGFIALSLCIQVLYCQVYSLLEVIFVIIIPSCYFKLFLNQMLARTLEIESN